VIDGEPRRGQRRPSARRCDVSVIRSRFDGLNFSRNFHLCSRPVTAPPKAAPRLKVIPGGNLIQSKGQKRANECQEPASAFLICLAEALLLLMTHKKIAVGGMKLEQKRLDILLVEDDVLLLMSLSEMLRDLGHTVYEAAGASEAIAFLNRHLVDVLITDIQMPEMTGDELAREARHIVPNLQVIYSSGYSRGRLMSMARNDPYAHFLPKPFGPDEIAQTFEKLQRALH
jgi:CheY-like chemotaxis protein